MSSSHKGPDEMNEWEDVGIDEEMSNVTTIISLGDTFN